MMSRKTERLYASELLDGTTMESTMVSFEFALRTLADNARMQGREALFDTLDVNIERTQIESLTLTGGGIIATHTTVNVSAEAVKVSETTTENTTKKDR